MSTVAWKVVSGDILLPAPTAAALAEALAVLVTAVHHPDDPRLAGEDPQRVARAVRGRLDELNVAADVAHRQQQALTASGDLDPDEVPTDLRLNRHGDQVRISPGSELSSIVLLLDIFAGAILREADHLRDARGPLAYAASALVGDLQRLTPEQAGPAAPGSQR